MKHETVIRLSKHCHPRLDPRLRGDGSSFKAESFYLLDSRLRGNDKCEAIRQFLNSLMTR